MVLSDDAYVQSVAKRIEEKTRRWIVFCARYLQKVVEREREECQNSFKMYMVFGYTSMQTLVLML